MIALAALVCVLYEGSYVWLRWSDAFVRVTQSTTPGRRFGPDYIVELDGGRFVSRESPASKRAWFSPCIFVEEWWRNR